MEKLKSIIKDFCKENLKKDYDWYHWKIKNDYLPHGIQLLDESRVFRNLSLKEQLHSKWSQSDIKTKGELIEYYIVRWGGIRGNKKETLDIYKTNSAQELINRGVNGVSSWSKALVLHDSNKYAIFDSRVSCSLNYLQIINDSKNKILFPILSSQNREITIANKNLKLISRDWKKLGYNEFYNFYLELLSATANELSTNISTIEMLLFAKATAIIDNI
jgi:hypothetical protein